MTTMTLDPHGFVNGDFISPEVRSYAGGLLQKQSKELTKVIEASSSKLTNIHDDRGLTPQGRHERAQAVLKDAVQQIGTLTKNRLPKIDQDLKRAVEALPKQIPNITPDKIEPAVLESKLREIRTDLAGMPELERVAAVRKAAESGDQTVLLAVQGASSIKRLVDEDELDTATQSFLEVKFPEQFERLETVEQAKRDYRYNATMARRALARAAGVQPSSLPRFTDNIADRAKK